MMHDMNRRARLAANTVERVDRDCHVAGARLLQPDHAVCQGVNNDRDWLDGMNLVQEGVDAGRIFELDWLRPEIELAWLCVVVPAPGSDPLAVILDRFG